MSQSEDKSDPAEEATWEDSWRPEDKAQEAEEAKARREEEPDVPPEPESLPGPISI